MTSHQNTARRSSDVVDPGPPYILQRRAPDDGPNAGDLRLQLRATNHDNKQFKIFCSILWGEDRAPDQVATGHNRGVPSGTGHDTLQPHGAELVTSTTTFWFPEYLNKAQISGSGITDDHVQPMKMAFEEVMKFDARATDVAKVFAEMDIDHVEFLLKHPEDLRSTLLGIVNDMETALPLDVLLPDSEPMTTEEDSR